ncbi:HAMP domain-containing histidine kinase [Pseudonocardia sp. RS11V-5]|uniref:sensor histidine kinase n=1 Tax=Pseudonocardia terrae TaxID=2905831 RepID=UPI001E34472E|nr:HAMP domain-containing sensor histidine kinase [Pseudonocardia terrae]MCE3551028.1 HAMP domain-containing histidine kinase [Pseudonocardia terrae]
MSLRTRFALAFALVAVVVAGLVGFLSYRAASDRTTDEIDRSLRATSAAVAAGQTEVLEPVVVPRGRGHGGGYGGGYDTGDAGDGEHGHDDDQPLVGQLVHPDGTVRFLGGREETLPVSATDRSLAASGSAGATASRDVHVDGADYRMLTTALGDGQGALQVATDADESERVLAGTAISILWVTAVVVLVAAAAGWLLARRITRRLVRLAGIAEEVSASGVVEREVPVHGRDEVGRLSASFTTMLARLAAARESQDRLVQDAAHELRTPLTSLRTNARVLRRLDELSPEARARLIDDVEGETRELSKLVEELVELALSRQGNEVDEPVDLAAVAERAAERVRRRTGRRIEVLVEDGVVPVRGRPRALDRAVTNLLENAAKFDEGRSEHLEVRVGGGRVAVADRGPGIAPRDAERVFDRFYRAVAARGLPGSGLGLAIVRDVAERHDGVVFAEAREGGGACVGFTVGAGRFLPGSEPAHTEDSPTAPSMGGTATTTPGVP